MSCRECLLLYDINGASLKISLSVGLEMMGNVCYKWQLRFVDFLLLLEGLRSGLKLYSSEDSFDEILRVTSICKVCFIVFYFLFK